MSDLNGWVPGMTLESVEKMVIQAAFHFYRGNKTQTATALGCSIRTLDNKLEKYEHDRRIEREKYEAGKLDNARILQRLRGISPSEPVESSRSSLYHADSGVHLESPTFTGQEHTVSVPQRAQVQNVLPTESPQGSAGSRGKKIPGANGKG